MNVKVLEEKIVAGAPLVPSKYSAVLEPPTASNLESVNCNFELPFDWLQLGRAAGNIQFVDQRNGDKLYVLRVQLPAESPSLAETSKKFFADAVFGPDGTIARSNEVDEYKELVKESDAEARQQLVSCSDISGLCKVQRRRISVKFSTTTSNGLVVPRRSILDCYEVGGSAYMMVTTTNQLKFEEGGNEMQTALKIAGSFVAVGRSVLSK